MWRGEGRGGGVGWGMGMGGRGGEGKISDDTKLIDVLLSKPMIHFKRENI